MAESDAPKGGGTVIADASAAPPPVESAGSQAISLGADLTGVTLLDRYQVNKKLGEGGMGTVYLGEHVTIKKKFAIKVLSAEFAHKPDLVERFLQEARAASMISQQNVVEITDFGDTPDGSVFFVMEYLNGEDLSDTVKNEGALPWDRVVPIMIQICSALQAAHDAGIIHRDMKPENCFRIKRGGNSDFIKVLDFGIAKVTTDEGGEGGKGLTRTGMIFGTPEYMSPEQAQGAKADHRVDVYAAGVIMYELLTGRVPFTADTFMGILTKHMFEVPEAPSAVCPEDVSIPPEAENIILKAMQKDREYRFQSMDEMAEAIKAVGTGVAGVTVISEDINRPQTTGHMDFVGGTGTTAPPIAAGEYSEPKSKKGLIFGLIGAVVLIGGGIGAFVALNNASEEKKAEAEADKAAQIAAAEKEEAEEAEEADEVEPAEPEPPPVQKVIAADIPTVEVKIETNVPAYVMDPADGYVSSLGKTGGEGVVFEKSKKKVKVVLRAEGYEDLELEVTPDRAGREYPHIVLTKKPEKKVVTTKKKKKKKAVTQPTKVDKVDPPPETKKKKKPPRDTGIHSPDLKDPFSGRNKKN